jgi:outer membrane lipopolysaccharide assembly protein LptE/RlpB
MPDFDLSIDIYILAAMLLLAAAAGFRLRSRQLAKKKRQIEGLERDVIQAHAELLESQRDYCELESKVKQEDSPVIPIKKKQDMSPGTGKTENF